MSNLFQVLIAMVAAVISDLIRCGRVGLLNQCPAGTALLNLFQVWIAMVAAIVSESDQVRCGKVDLLFRHSSNTTIRPYQSLGLDSDISDMSWAAPFLTGPGVDP